MLSKDNFQRKFNTAIGLLTNDIYKVESKVRLDRRFVEVFHVGVLPNPACSFLSLDIKSAEFHTISYDAFYTFHPL
jgi:hypothetical protein